MTQGAKLNDLPDYVLTNMAKDRRLRAVRYVLSQGVCCGRFDLSAISNMNCKYGKRHKVIRYLIYQQYTSQPTVLLPNYDLLYNRYQSSKYLVAWVY